jgi:RNA polymerase sigma-70 factor (ECF subfamily)
LEENRLVELARSDPEAFGELYRRNVDRIYTYVFYRVGSATDAEDLTARTFYQALGSVHRYVDQGVPFLAWLYRIAHNSGQSPPKSSPLERSPAGPVRDLGKATERPEVTVEAERQQALVMAIRRQPEERQRLPILKFAGTTVQRGNWPSWTHRELHVSRFISEPCGPGGRTLRRGMVTE